MAKAYHHGDLRTALLEAAAELLDEGGPEAVSLRECARRAGVSHAAPYRHFETKDALLFALADEGFGWLAESGAKAMHGIRNARDRLDAYGAAYVRFAIENPARFRLMFGGAQPAKPAVAETNGPRAYALLRDSVHAVIGDVDDEELDAATAAAWSLPHGLAMLILDGRVQVPNARAAERLARESFSYWRTSK